MGLPVPALFRHYPAVADHLPWTPIAKAPTPVERLELPGAPRDAELWVKRDDRSGEPYGGSKVRKLEFLLARARGLGATRLVTAGAVGSHHALATTLYGRALGFSITLVLFPQPLTGHVRRVLLLDHALGAELHWAPRMELIPLMLMRARWAHRRERCYVIPPGGSDPWGTLGYVSAGLELAEQVARGEAPAPETIHVAAGTLGTAAGLALGCALGGLDTRLHATRITRRLVTNRGVLHRLIAGTAQLLRAAGVRVPPPSAVAARVELSHDQLGAGYGHATASGRAAEEAFGTVGLQLDPTYTAKAAAGFLAGAATARGPRLFWSTLGRTEPVLAAVPDDSTRRLPAPFRRYLDAGGVATGHG